MKVIKLHYNEKDLIVAAVKKDRLAQKTIYEKFSPKMLAICNRYVKNIAEAEDVMITSFMKVFTQIQNFENKGSLEGWIRKIMVNDAISFLRTKKQFSKLNAIYAKNSIYSPSSKFNDVEQLYTCMDCREWY